MGSEGDSSVENWQKQLLFTEKMKVFLRRNPITTMTRNPITRRPDSEQGALGTGSSSQPDNILSKVLFTEQIKAFMNDMRTAEDN